MQQLVIWVEDWAYGGGLGRVWVVVEHIWSIETVQQVGLLDFALDGWSLLDCWIVVLGCG